VTEFSDGAAWARDDGSKLDAPTNKRCMISIRSQSASGGLAELPAVTACRKACRDQTSCRPAATSDQAAREQDGKNENLLSRMPSCFTAYVLLDN
jgi:hypothetical protein